MMMNETLSHPATANAGTSPGTSPFAGKPPVVPPPPVAGSASAGSPAPFGGHRGGGKRRKDGLIAGSPEAIAADKAKDNERKKAAYHAKRAAQLPPPLPSAPLATNPPAIGASAPVPPGGTPVPAAASVSFVAWSSKLLAKPAKLIVRIVDRLRLNSVLKRLEKSTLPEKVKESIKSKASWAEEAKQDFADSLAECATVELNQRNVSSRYAHWINLGMSAGELTLAHFDLMNEIDKLILEERLTREKLKTEAEKR